MWWVKYHRILNWFPKEIAKEMERTQEVETIFAGVRCLKLVAFLVVLAEIVNGSLIGAR